MASSRAERLAARSGWQVLPPFHFWRCWRQGWIGFRTFSCIAKCIRFLVQKNVNSFSSKLHTHCDTLVFLHKQAGTDTIWTCMCIFFTILAHLLPLASAAAVARTPPPLTMPLSLAYWLAELSHGKTLRFWHNSHYRKWKLQLWQ